MKTAVVLFNLGGPDKPESVKPFLFNLFSDKAIITLPQPLRFFVAWLISSRREKKAQEIYAHIGGASPLLPLTRDQAAALESELATHGEFRVFVSMRYWHPFSRETAEEVKKYNPDQVILLPLYPQFSTTTTASSLADWKKSFPGKTLEICCYPENAGFIKSHAEIIAPLYEKALSFTDEPSVLFSAHSLPLKTIESGDSYQWQVEKTAKLIAAALNLTSYTVCYQSKVGPLEWLGPSTEECIRKAGEAKKPVVVVPVSFVSEHSETLVELDVLFKKLAAESGVPAYFRVPALGTSPSFIKSLASLCLARINSPCRRICPSRFEKCMNSSPATTSL